jgi:hypothetical protein
MKRNGTHTSFTCAVCTHATAIEGLCPTVSSTDANVPLTPLFDRSIDSWFALYQSETGHRELLQALPAAGQRRVPCPRLLPSTLVNLNLDSNSNDGQCTIHSIACRRNPRDLGRPIPVLPKHPRRRRSQAFFVVAGGRDRPRPARLRDCRSVRRPSVVDQGLLGTMGRSLGNGVAALQDDPGQHSADVVVVVVVGHAICTLDNSSRSIVSYTTRQHQEKMREGQSGASRNRLYVHRQQAFESVCATSGVQIAQQGRVLPRRQQMSGRDPLSRLERRSNRPSKMQQPSKKRKRMRPFRS